MGKIRFYVAVIGLVAMLPAAHAQQVVAGQVLWLFGDVSRVNAEGVAKPLAKGDALLEGDVVRTGANSHVQLLMSDQALLAVRPESTLRLTGYLFTGREDGGERAWLELFKGGLRSITGAIGTSNKENYKLKTHRVLVGIRGTDHETFFVPGSGTYNRVTVGGTYMQSPDGRIDLAPGEVGFSSEAPGSAPARLQRTPGFMQVAALQHSVSASGMRARSAGDEHRLAVSMGAPFNGGVIARGTRTVPGQATMTILPSQALGGCGASCTGDALGGIGRGVGKGIGKGAGKGGI